MRMHIGKKKICHLLLLAESLLMMKLKQKERVLENSVLFLTYCYCQNNVFEYLNSMPLSTSLSKRKLDGKFFGNILKLTIQNDVWKKVKNTL